MGNLHDTLYACFRFVEVDLPMTPTLTAAQTRFLRGQAHGLKALWQVGGKGVSPAVVAEIDAALEQHELIKVRIAAAGREERAALVQQLATECHAALVQTIGHVAVLYRPSQERRQIVLPRGPSARP